MGEGSLTPLKLEGAEKTAKPDCIDGKSSKVKVY